MRSTFHGLETARRSLFTQQAALSTTGHNIANANTEGYTRQIVNMQASRPIEAVGLQRSNAPGQLGTGVEFSSIKRIREGFLDSQFRNENKALGSWTVQNDTLEKLEAIVNEPSDSGFRTVLDNFWKSWSDLSKDPDNVTNRKIVRENAIALADTFNLTSKQLSDLSSDLTENIDVKVAQINSNLTSIANLNQQILRIEGLGNDANDLRDQRDLLTDEISKIINIEVMDTPQGYNINMGTVALVAGNTVTPATADSMQTAFSSGDLNSGEIYGLIVSRDLHVADYQSQLDTLADTIANGEVTLTIPEGSVLPEGTVLNGVAYTGTNRTLTSDLTVQVDGINGLHKLGYTLNDPLTSGGDFFTSNSGGAITAASFQLNPAIAANPNIIATSMRTDMDGGVERVIKGNNSLALLASGLKDSTFTFTAGSVIGNGTIDDFYRSVVGQLGVEAREANRQALNQSVIVEQVNSRRLSVSGVSLDEEMTNMIKFQHAYNAAARNITAVDEMLDRIINGMGVVGR